MKYSEISWTHHTFNPWWGCTKVSPACDNCYAEDFADRFGGATWGINGERRFFGPEHWNGPVKWNSEAEQKKIRFRVFCASMADVYEDRPDLVAERQKLWELVGRTPALDWLLLTKRPQNAQRLSPWGGVWPGNVWLGTSIENQKYAERRIPILGAIPARVRFLSCEPLLGALALSTTVRKGVIDWIIAGGESGPVSRPMNPDWVRGIRDFCASQEIPFHFKQWGQWGPPSDTNVKSHRSVMSGGVSFTMASVGKLASGRELDGRTHDGFPA